MKLKDANAKVVACAVVPRAADEELEQEGEETAADGAQEQPEQQGSAGQE